MVRKGARRALGAALAAAAGALALWAYLEGREEREKERELERPAAAPRRLARDAAGRVLVILEPGAQARIGIEVEPPALASLPREVRAYGKVLDPEPLIVLHGELAASEAARAASRAEHERVKALHRKGQNLSRKALEAAESEHLGDEARARTLARRMANLWGQALAALPPEEREALVERLAARRAVLVRADLPLGETLAEPPAAGSISLAGEENLKRRADRIVEAPQVDGRLLGQAFLLQVEAPPPSLRPGAAAAVQLELGGTPRKGLVVPPRAVVRFEGRAWVYVQEGPDRFVRREIALGQRLERGWLVSQGLEEGQGVVVTGAQSLLSEELRSRIRIEDEDE